MVVDSAGSARPWRTRIYRGVVLLLSLCLLCALLAYGLLWRSLPPVSGTRTGRGLDHATDIVRDAHGIPHIYARNEHDAYFALGYAHAQDRLWQLEMNRRAGSGTLSEAFGADLLEHDKLVRTLGFRRVAAQNLERLDPDTRAVLDAYTLGINSWLRDPEFHVPPELALLQVAPEPWQALDSLVILKLMAWELSGQYERELLRTRVIAQLGAAGAREVMSGIPADTQALQDVTGAVAPASAALLAWREQPSRSPAIGSNSWAVPGGRTKSLAPLLANDPHMALSAPALWYLAHLEAPSLHVIGASLPGLPGVLLGSNSQVAWSFTNTRADTQDFYLERVDPADADRYLSATGPRAFEHVRERIRVRGAAEVVLDVRTTRHGPVVSDVNGTASSKLPAGHVLALAFTALLPEDTTLKFSLDAAHARNAAELLKAARNFQSPPQNIVCADSAGATEFVAAGRVPLRAADNELRGLVPMPGWQARYDWQGFIGFDELPHVSGGDSGRIITANHDITPAGYRHWISADWACRARADRIGTLLEAQSKHDVASFTQIQGDVRSEHAARLLPLLLQLAPKDADPVIITGLQRWDYAFDKDRWEPVVFAAWLRELGRMVYEDELGPLLPELWADTPDLLEDVLLDHAGRGHVCDDRRSPERESCAQMIARAYERARPTWARSSQLPRWGELHRARFQHEAFGEVWPLSKLFDVLVESGGANETVSLGEYAVTDDADQFTSHYGPGYRAVYDLGAPEQSKFIVAPGQSGHPLSPSYRDLAPAWSRGELLPMVTERARVEQGALGTLVLRPD